jgi:putative phosphoribosyl transferase
MGVMGALFHDRLDAGRQLAAALERRQLRDAVVVGLARGGVPVAAEVARRLSLPLDALAVRKVGYPGRPEYGIGAVTPGHGGIYVRSHEDLDELELRRVVETARTRADALDQILHEHRRPLDLDGKTAVLVDDGLATGATMVAAARWARSQGATRVVVAVPVGAAPSVRLLWREADEVVCPHPQEDFGAVGLWYDRFTQVENDEVVALLDELQTPPSAPDDAILTRRDQPAAPGSSPGAVGWSHSG